MYFMMVVVFTFFYTDVLFSQQNYGENLKKGRADSRRVRPVPDPEVPDQVQRRITLPGALFLGLVAGYHS